MWLKDFLPYDIPNIRIMTYGYDSSLVGSSRTNSRLLDYQRSFTQEIENARSSVPVSILVFGSGYIACANMSFLSKPDRSYSLGTVLVGF